MQRVVLLGASNLTISFPLVLENLQAGLPGPLEVWAAAGHGRSYGMWSRVLFRELPGITQCDLWRDLEAGTASARPPVALITDVGNDLMYGASVSEILGWVDTCLQRLSAGGSDTVITLLPLASVERLSVWRYELTRTMFFPRRSRTLRMPVVLERVRALNAGLQRLGERFGARLVEPRGEWYGIDPIHIRRSHRAAVWREILSGWPSFRVSESSSPGESTSSAFQPMERAARAHLLCARSARRLRPADRRLFGRRQLTPQPVLRAGESTLWLY